MTPAQRERDLATWRKKLELASLPPIERDMAGYPIFRSIGREAAVTEALRIWVPPIASYLPPGARASWRRGTWA